ncbi:amidohydrolase family protein [Nocardioides sp. CFH 31398]|uniref:amidohydrolase family protein n=1 Tax=Nocardioides sp. CFH 31398 TaxID=2919579 RepID=UPI001F0670EE|nr:amidohydrolase family protein [Nocardioides sp. CFH 31398]MCH1864992.1 amidohydrolase [Nocardioides sp. CFH 31398]
MKRFPCPLPTVVDVHQHLWPEPLVEALRRRTRAPRLVGWTLHLEGEPPYEVDPATHDLAARAGTDRADGVGLTLLSLSAPLGLERLPAEESTPLLDGWHGLADDVGDAHGLWAAPRLVEPDPAELAATLARPRVHGLQVPADAMGSPARLEALAPLLAVAEAADVPVLVHPGPAVPTDPTDAALPGWWPALTSYVAQQAAAWFAWHVAGRALLPRLRVAFVGLAGLAPLHHERLTQRGGTLGAIDRGVFYETSSYGARAVDAMARVVGVDPLVLGSDRPYAVATDLSADPGLGEAFSHAVRSANPHHLLQGGPR